MVMVKFFAISLYSIHSIQALSSIPRPAAYTLNNLLNTATGTISSSLVAAKKQDGLCGGRVETLSGLFRQEALLLDRDVTVWLPPNYDNDVTQRYPVLYCHDGQNAMNDQDSWTGASWRLMAALTRVPKNSIDMPIVVMIPSASGDLLPGIRRRHLEYASLTSPLAVAHTNLVAKTIKPTIDRQFRTLSDVDHTFAIGSSLGGQASLNLLLKYPDIFGGAACLSPYFSVDTISSARAAVARGEFGNKRIYLDIGGDSTTVKVRLFDLQDHLTEKHWWNPGYFWLDTSLQASVTSMDAALRTPKGNVRVQHCHFPGARHNERAWAERIHVPLLHILGK